MMVALPIRTISEANTRSHWAARAARVKRQRTVVALTLRAMRLHVPCVVTLTRVAPSSGLDDDNLRGALKAVRDGVADALGVDDRHPGVTWLYGQRRGSARAYAVEIVISDPAVT